jgi:hypothetical protein
MSGFEPGGAVEAAFDDWVIRLDGTVVEVFHRLTHPSARYHVDHIAVEAKPRGEGLRLKIGNEVSGIIIGQRVDVPAQARSAVLALFTESRRRRDALARDAGR